MNNTRRRRPQGPARRRPLQGQNMQIAHPPSIGSYEVRHSTTLRFVSNATIATNITFQNLLDTILFAATAVLGYDVFASVKVRRVRVWSLPVVGNASTVSVIYAGLTAGAVGDQKLHTDTSMGIQPAHVDARPAPRSLASNYQVSSTAIAFVIDCPTGSVIDVDLSFIGAFEFVQAAQNALVGATVGATLLRGLDGLAAAGSKMLPIYPAGTI